MRHGSSVAGVADPGRGAERLTERLFGTGPDAKKRFRSHCLEGCGLGANYGNRGRRTRLQWRRRTFFWHGGGCGEAVSYSPTRTSALPGQLWKPVPTYPATVAAPNVSPNVFLGMRITGFVLADEDVSAPGPSVETGPAYPASGKSTSQSSTDPTPSVSGADGASPTSLGCESWESTRKKKPAF